AELRRDLFLRRLRLRPDRFAALRWRRHSRLYRSHHPTRSTPRPRDQQYHILRPRRAGRAVHVQRRGHRARCRLQNRADVFADIDHDGHIGLSDLALLLSSFGLSMGQTGYNAYADLDGDHTVQLSDLSLLLANFGS